jgi:hypothetical protein
MKLLLFYISNLNKCERNNTNVVVNLLLKFSNHVGVLFAKFIARHVGETMPYVLFPCKLLDVICRLER